MHVQNSKVWHMRPWRDNHKRVGYNNIGTHTNFVSILVMLKLWLYLLVLFTTAELCICNVHLYCLSVRLFARSACAVRRHHG